MNINDFIIKDMAWTLRHFKDKIIEWENLPFQKRDENKDPYELAANAMLIVTKIGFGSCFSIDDFIECVENGEFIDDDGVGRWIDKEGHNLGYIRCDVNWLKNNKPEDAKFIMWYNK